MIEQLTCDQLLPRLTGARFHWASSSSVCAHDLVLPPFHRFLAMLNNYRGIDLSTLAVDALLAHSKPFCDNCYGCELMVIEGLRKSACWRRSFLLLVSYDCYARAELEARILAGQEQTLIGERLPSVLPFMSPFEYFFFDVREKLWAREWILRGVLQYDQTVGLYKRDVLKLWRLAGFELGVEAVDALTTGVSRKVLDRMGIAAYLRPKVRIPGDLKHWIIERTLALSAAKLLPARAKYVSALTAALVVKDGAADAAPELQTDCTPDGLPLMTEKRVLALARACL